MCYDASQSVTNRYTIAAKRGGKEIYECTKDVSKEREK